MNYTEYFPFLNRSFVIGSKVVNDFDLYNERYITSGTNVTHPDILNKVSETSGVSKGSTVPIIHVMPNNVYLYAGNDPSLSILLNSANRPATVNAEVVTVDYGRLAQNIVMATDNKVACYRSGSDYMTQDISSEQFISDAVLGVESDISNLTVTNEDNVDDLFKGISMSIDTNVQTDPPFYEVIKLYLQSSTPTEKIPLLVGMSGIAKSAMVKDIANQLGMRMVDLRVSFMSRLDIDGLSEIVGKEIGEPVTINAPMVEFLTCTDEYIEFSKKAVTLIEEKLKTVEDEYQKSQLQVALNKFKESAKVPVLFFDELTRSDKSIRGALTTIINQRLYGQYHLNQARMIAATNAPVGYEDDDDMQDLFIGASLEDVAVLDRFNKIPLHPEEVYPKWIEWAKSHFVQVVVDYLTAYPDRSYDISPAVDKAHDYDRTDDLVPAYPTFRAWENISDYLKTLDDKKFSVDIINGLLGETNGAKFMNYLKLNGYSSKYLGQSGTEEHLDQVTDFVSDSLDAGLPTMVMGVSGLGKTTRIREYCQKNGYDFELISLSTKDRLDIMGPPAKVDITRYIAKENSGILDELGLTTELSDLKTQSGLPNCVTVRSPKSELQERIRKSTESGRPLVLLMDEFNRCIDPTVQSSIFQAISDNQFGGVHFKKGQVKVALAGNIGETTREAGRVDAALTARAVQFKKLSYDESDAVAVINYMKSHGYAQSLLDYIGNDTEKVLKLIKSVDEGSLTTNVSSTRSLKALSDMLNESTASKRLHGSLLCPDDTAVQEFTISGATDDSVLESMINRILPRLNNWAALGSYTYPGGTPLDKAIEVFKQGVTLYNESKSKGEQVDDRLRSNLTAMIYNMLSIDSSISDYRGKTFSYYVDKDFAEEFTKYYNVTSGVSTSISIEDLTDDTTTKTYIVSQFNKLDPSTPEWSTIVKAIYDYYKTRFTPNHYYEIIVMCINNDTSTENSRNEMKKVLGYAEFERMIMNTESSSTSAEYRNLILALKYTLADYSKVAVTYSNTAGIL